MTLMRTRLFPALSGVVACAAAPVLLTGCTVERPQPVAIGVDASSTEQIVLGEIYSQIFDQMGYASTVVDLPAIEADPVEQLRTAGVDLVIACTGELLRSQDRAAAEALIASGEEGEALSVATYDAVVATFPGEVRTVDPSPAMGCASGASADELPQNIIPVFKDTTFDRQTAFRLNFITRVMATDRIEEMVDAVEDGSSVEDALAEWMMEYAHIDVYADEVADPDDSGAAAGDSADQSGAR